MSNENAIRVGTERLTIVETHRRFLPFEQAAKLGRIHWYLLKATSLLREQSVEPASADGRDIDDSKSANATRKLSDLGKEIGGDEIHWWVEMREPAMYELERRTETALTNADNLKKASRNCHRLGCDYAQHISNLSQFVEMQTDELIAIEEYVAWLFSRDPRSPAILFAYRVWGTTRLFNRAFEVREESVEDENPDTIFRLAEIVLGLWNNGCYRFDHEQYEASYEMYEARDPENGSCDAPSYNYVSRRATSEAMTNFAEYFQCLRDSMRNVLVEIGKCTVQRKLIADDSFWRQFITVATQSGKSETRCWDFKETLNIWHINQPNEKRKASVHLAELVAAFANADGGVLIIGVTDDRKIVGLGDQTSIEDRMQHTEEVVARHVQYDRKIFRLQEVRISDDAGVDTSCLVLIVAQAKSAVAVNDENRFTYPMRLASGLQRQLQLDITMSKLNVRADNHDFIVNELEQLIRNSPP